MSDKTYTVWVGGTEVVDYYLTLSEAVDVKNHYLELDYDDVVIEEVENEQMPNQRTFFYSDQELIELMESKK